MTEAITPTPQIEEIKLSIDTEEKSEITPSISPAPESPKKGKGPGGECPCVDLARQIFNKFKEYVEHRNAFDMAEKKGRITQAIEEIEKTDVGKNELKQQVFDWKKLLADQERIYQENVRTLQNMSKSVPTFQETNTKAVRDTCTPADWADAMNEIAYVTNQALRLFANGIVDGILKVPSVRATKMASCKVHQTKEACEKHGDGNECAWKTPLILKNTCEMKQPTSSTNLVNLANKVRTMLTVSPAELQKEADLARANYAILLSQTFQQYISPSESGVVSLCSIDECKTFGQRLADEVWNIKVARNPKYTPVPDDEFDEFKKRATTPEIKTRLIEQYSRQTPATQKILKELKNIRQQLNLLSLPQAKCKPDLVVAYIIWMWAVNDQL